jgi:hypothetical protein
MRATTSLPPPGGNGEMSFTGWFGNAWPRAAVFANTATRANAVRAAILMGDLLLFVYSGAARMRNTTFPVVRRASSASCAAAKRSNG